MSDKDFPPLTPAIVRGLNDKMYEKRKVAALEIEKMIRDYQATNNTTMILRILTVLGQEFSLSQNANSRKGGLIGLAACAIALGKDAPVFVQQLVRPVLSSFFDSDSRVRYYGCESLYNIVKVTRGAVLPFFNEVFDGLSKLAADPEQTVRSGSELLDRLMKDVVTESNHFDLVSFIPLLRERIYAVNPASRQFIVSWISALDSVPDVDMLQYLSQLLDGLFKILGDGNPEIKKSCEACLGEFLISINKEPSKVDFASMINVVIIHSQSEEELVQYTALQWLSTFVHLSGRNMLPYISGMILSVLPCLDHSAKTYKGITDVAKSLNSSLMKLIQPEDDATDETEVASQKGNEDSSGPKQTLDLVSLVEALTHQLVHKSVQTRSASLKWLYKLFITVPHRTFHHVDELFPMLLKTLSDQSDEVVPLDLEVLAEISSSPAGQGNPCSKLLSEVNEELRKSMKLPSHQLNPYFLYIMLSMMKLFSTDRQLLEDRGAFIIRQLCVLLNSEDIYRCIAQILIHEEDLKFASSMIQSISTILLTSTELFELRCQLKDMGSADTCDLFCCLYKSFCHNPVSTVALCFLTQNYQHASQILSTFGDLEVTVDLLVEVDKLVQLIESPIFTYLRLQLLDAEKSQELVRSLYSLLMLLPQSDAFRVLHRRLECVPRYSITPAEHRYSTPMTSAVDDRPFVKEIQFGQLLEHFLTIQATHKKMKRRDHRSLLPPQVTSMKKQTDQQAT